MLQPLSEAAGWVGPPSTSSRSPPDVPESTPQFPHAVQAAAPRAEVVPAAHGVQLAAPAAEAIVPAGQAIHAIAPTAEVVPGSHLVQVVAPATLVNEPAVHAVQSAFAVVVHSAAWKEPVSQTLHALQLPPPRKNAVGQLPHWFGFGPEQAAQLASHAPQTVFAVEVHAAD